MIDLINGDCMDFMRDLPDDAFELAIVDPPYGIGANKKRGDTGKNSHIKQKDYHIGDWDNCTPPTGYFDELRRVSRNQIVWGGNYFPYLWGHGGKAFVFWDKHQPVNNFSDGELAWTSFDKPAKKFDFSYYGNIEGKTNATNKIHPTQKPVKLYEWLLTNYAKPGDRILDTHGGSMSIAIACHNLGFDLTCIELDKDYFEAGKARLEQHMKQPRMFEMPVEKKEVEQGSLI